MPADWADAAAAAGYILDDTALSVGRKYRGKVRDTYALPNSLVLITTDRMSAFDRHLASVPFKGAVLNQTTAWWMEQTRHIVPNALVAVPHPNVTIMKRCVPFRVEFVVRAYLTGSTSTSIWVHYSQQGARSYCGHALPEGMKKNQPLPYVMVTPTTKEEAHDRPVSGAEVVSTGLMSQADWDYVSGKALEVFRFGQEQAASRGLILVDTKYEFGRDEATGEILLIDEVHTPDSSRYWLKATYEERMAAGQEPDNIDKEFLRIWFRKNCDPYGDAKLPAAPPELVAELSRRYVKLYEMITGQGFVRPASLEARPSSATITAALAPYCLPAPRTVVVVRTGTEEEAGPAEAAADELVRFEPRVEGQAVRTAVAVEVYAVNAVDKPLELLEAARASKGRVAAAVVVGGPAVGATAAVLARHGGVPTIAVGDVAALADVPPGLAVTAASTPASAVAFVKASLKF